MPPPPRRTADLETEEEEEEEMGMEEVEVEATEPLAGAEEGEPREVGTTGRADYQGNVFLRKKH